MKQIFLLLAIAFMFSSCSTSKKASNISAAYDKNLNDTTVYDGSSYEKAIIIKEKSEESGVKAEYGWLNKYYPGYKLKKQNLNFHNKKPYDIMEIITPDGEDKSIYFDISNFYGKF